MFSKTGNCRICGAHGRLTFEHIPPQAAGNRGKVTLYSYEDVLRSHHGVPLPKGRQQQRGAGGYLLCGRCNSDLSPYARAYGDFAMQAGRVEPRTNRIAVPFRLRPLFVLKQVVAMFACLNAGGLEWPGLVQFIRNRSSRALPTGYRFYVYRCWDLRVRHFGWMQRANFAEPGSVVGLSEVAMTPLGCLATTGERRSHEILTEITDWNQFRPDQHLELWFRLPCVPIVADFPGDYRSQTDIDKAVEESYRKELADRDGA